MAAKQPKLKTFQEQAARQGLEYYQPLLQWAAQNAGLPLPQQQQGIGGQMGTGPMGLPQGQPSAQQQLAQMPMAGAAGRGEWSHPGAQPRMQQPPPRASILPVGGQPGGMRPEVQQLQQNAQQQFAQFGQAPQAGVLGGQALGVYGQNPADVYRLQQAEEDINRQANQRARLLQYRLGQQGIGGSGVAADALRMNEMDALRGLSDFRRQLAIGSGQEQERRLSLLMQLLGLGTAQGAQSQSVTQAERATRKPSALDQLVGVAGAAAPYFT